MSRPVGSKNKRTLVYREELKSYAKSKNYDPIKALIRMATDKRKDANGGLVISDELRYKCHLTVASYFVSPLKAVDAETGSSDDVQVHVTLEGPESES